MVSLDCADHSSCKKHARYGMHAANVTALPRNGCCDLLYVLTHFARDPEQSAEALSRPDLLEYVVLSRWVPWPAP